MIILIILFMFCLLLALIYMVKFNESVKIACPDWKSAIIATLGMCLSLCLVIIRHLLLQ